MNDEFVDLTQHRTFHRYKKCDQLWRKQMLEQIRQIMHQYELNNSDFNKPEESIWEGIY